MRNLLLTNSQVADARQDLPFAQSMVYLDNAAVSPVPVQVRKAADSFNHLTVHHLREASHISTIEFDRGRALAADLVGSRAENIAYVQNTSHGLSLTALGIDWQAGDNLVIPALEFPSSYLCWLQLQALGVAIRTVQAVDGQLRAQDIAPYVDRRTRLVAISHVQFYSGYRVDLAAVAEICAANGALLVVDGTQSIGAISLDVGQTGVDVLVVSGHKWMMAPRGIGFMALSAKAMNSISPRILGWLSVNNPYAFERKLDFLPDARRFESGTPNGAGIYGLTKRLEQIRDLEGHAIERHVLHLCDHLKNRCREAGMQLVYDFNEDRQSSILLIQKKDVSAEAVRDRLQAHQICASVRNNAVRLSPHYYNTVDELDLVIEVLIGRPM